MKLPTLLEGEALAIFTEIGEDERKDYHKDRRFEKGISKIFERNPEAGPSLRSHPPRRILRHC